MPARKHRTGADLADWEARKTRRLEAMDLARERAMRLSGHTLVRPIEAAAMLGVTLKTLRELEAGGKLPPRVTFSAKVFGWRLADIEATIDARAASAGPDAAA
jgi:predicted DNA-binding transcriptional regulator AlpA